MKVSWWKICAKFGAYMLIFAKIMYILIGRMISKCPRGQYIHGKENVNACPQGIDTWSKLL